MKRSDPSLGHVAARLWRSGPEEVNGPSQYVPVWSSRELASSLTCVGWWPLAGWRPVVALVASPPRPPWMLTPPPQVPLSPPVISGRTLPWRLPPLDSEYPLPGSGAGSREREVMRDADGGLGAATKHSSRGCEVTEVGD
jgi:hypothetical protein